MQLPFTAEQFFDVFERYNTDMPFAGHALTIAACAAVVLLFTFFRKFSFLVLGLLWFWAGAVYHIAYFADVNPVATIFGTAFILQGLLLSFFALTTSDSKNETPWNGRRYAGASLIVLAIVIYPLLGKLFGHEFPRSPTFGLPCPLTIFTFGSLLLGRRSVPLYLTIIPLAWAVMGMSASVLFGVCQDLALLLSAFVFVAVSVWSHRNDPNL